MPLNVKGLSLKPNGGNYANPGTVTAIAFTEATYISPDAAAVIEAANYFGTAAGHPGLIKTAHLKIVSSCNGTPVLKSYVVTSNDGTTVVIALQIAVAG